jgi:hypothetical protein
MPSILDADASRSAVLRKLGISSYQSFRALPAGRFNTQNCDLFFREPLGLAKK